MKKALSILALCLAVAAADAIAQNCSVQRPASPPHADRITIITPGDGGSQGCFLVAACRGCLGVQNQYSVPAGACSTFVLKGDLALAKDNGWDDGGTL